MPTSIILNTYEHPIPTWKGPIENGVPVILTISADAPPISAISGSDLPFWCATTQFPDVGISGGDKILGSEFDDQS
jgi:hypothetical protein